MTGSWLPRPAQAAILLLLGGCQTITVPVAGPAPPGSPANTVALHVAILECNAFRLAIGRRYCAPVDPPPEPPRACTRSLGTVDCWDTPNPFGTYQRGVADGPSRLTLQQEWNRTGTLPPYHEPE